MQDSSNGGEETAALCAMRPSYEIREYDGPMNIHADCACILHCISTVNHCPEEVMVYPLARDNGGVAVARPFKYDSGSHPRIVIYASTFQGYFNNVPNNGFGLQNLKVRTVEITVHYDQLLQDAIYIDELDISVCIGSYMNRLKVVHPTSNEYLNELHNRNVRRMCSLDTTVPGMYITGNDPTGKIDKIYNSLNGIPYPIKIDHNEDQKRCLNLTIFNELSETGKLTSRTIPLSFDDLIKNEVCFYEEGSTYAIFGTNRFKVQERYKEYLINKRTTTYDKDIQEHTEYNRIEDAKHIKRLEDELAHYKDQNALLIKKQKELLEQYGQNYDIIKFNHESRIQELKVKQTEHATTGTAATSVGNVAKAAIVIIPIAAAAIVAAKAVTASAAVVACAGAAIATTIGVATSVVSSVASTAGKMWSWLFG